MTTEEYNKAVKAYSSGIYRFAIKFLKDQMQADDIVQDAFLKLWQNKESVFNEKAKSWLFTTAHHSMLNQIKKDKRTESMETADYEEPYDTSSQRYELRQLIDQGLGQLSEVQRSIILLRDLEGYQYKEIGEMLSLSEEQVKVYLFRARKKIKNMLKQNITHHENN